MTRLLLTADAVGGVWQYATDLAGALAGREVEPMLAVLGPAPTSSQRAALNGIELVETGLPLDWLATDEGEARAAAAALARIADRVRADIVQLNAPALAAGAPFGRPLVAVAHSCVGTWWEAVKTGPIDPDLAWRAELTARGLRAADRVVAPSAAFADALRRRYDLSRTPTVVRNGRRPLALPELETETFAFTAGRLWDEGKNITVLDRAAARTGVPILAAGPTEGPNGAAPAFRAIRALGRLDEAELADRLACRPVFVSPSLYEPFGLAVLEAAQAGCALVLSDIPTFRELWDGIARFVDAHDADGFAQAIDALASDPALRSRLGREAQERSRRYTVERMADAMLGLYRNAALPAAERVAA